MAPSLRDLQIASLLKVLNLNHGVPSSGEDGAQELPVLEAEEPIWKVLVFDNFGREVISSVLRVSDLRAQGVTLHIHISSANKQPIPDCPAIYLLAPTQESIKLLLGDLTKGLYSPVYLNWTSTIPRVLLEDFAGQVAAAGVSTSIASVYDQFLDFIVSEPDLFSLGLSDSYYLINSGKTSDEDLDAAIDRCVSGLFSVCVTMKALPIIRCPKDGAAALIAPKLDRRLRDSFLSSKDSGLFGSEASTTSRPLLVLVDRNADITPMLSHSWSYQSLVSDILESKLQQITVEVPSEDGSKPVKKQFDLKANDDFWAANAASPFPNVAEQIDLALAKYKEDAKEITRKAGVGSLEDLDSGADAAQLKAAITLLPELKERKNQLDMHMTILSALLQGIKSRTLDNYFSLEENILAKQPISKAELRTVIDSKEKGGNDPVDRLRLFIIWYLTGSEDLSRSDFDSLSGALADAGCDTSCLTYIKQLRSITRMTMLNQTSSAPTQQSPGDLFSTISSRLTSGLRDAGISTNVEALTKGLRNLMPSTKDLTLTQIVHSLMSPTEAPSAAIAKTENYLYFDPRSANARGTMPSGREAKAQGGPAGGYRGLEASFGQRRQGFSECVAFTVGGGSMDEYGNLMEFASRNNTAGAATNKRFRITYGSTEILRPSRFVEQLQVLGKESA